MKRIFAIIFWITMFSSTMVWAEDVRFKKLGRGLTNIVTSPMEIPREVRAHWIKGTEKTYHVSVWFFSGLVKGLVMVPVRFGSGVYDVITFPIDYPPGNKPLLKPDYVFDEWPKRQEGVVYKNIGDQ
jgi:putative exosortase-associated protein (TIGR04073 family)